MSGRPPRNARVERRTKETQVTCTLRLDGQGRTEIATGLGMLDHMLGALALHGRLDLELCCKGDLHVDDHHTVEDCALVLGQALKEALGERRGIARFGHAYAPLDEALARCEIDLSGRPWPAVTLDLRREQLGDVATENLTHFLQSLAIASGAALHVDVLRGANDHHKAEAAFKALALALRAAVAPDPSYDASDDRTPSTKGVLS